MTFLEAVTAANGRTATITLKKTITFNSKLIFQMTVIVIVMVTNPEHL